MTSVGGAAAVSPELVRLAAALVAPSTRAAASGALARVLGGNALLVFVRDAEIDAMLPALGFPQTLPNGRAWHAFLAGTLADGRRVGVLSLSSPEDARPALGIAAGDDVVCVLLGVADSVPDAEAIVPLLPLLAAAFRGERSAALAQVQARIARDALTQERAVAAALERARGQLQKALLDARRVRTELEAANAQLQEHSHDLEAQAAELESQADELETQSAELHLANAELRTARAAADAANLAKSEFLATMSHELRTPLNAIGGHVQLMELGIHGQLSDAQREALSRIQRSQRKLLGLINDILNLARIESGRVDYAMSHVRVADLVPDLAAMIGPQVAAKGQHYEVVVADPTVCAWADREKLEQVLLNLLSNAVKFTEVGGRVTIEVPAPVPASGVTVVHVRDSGIGIAAGKLDSIFEPFVQVDSTRTRLGEGTGLGLAISRDLARGMGGELTVESDPGVGSTFTLTLVAEQPVAAKDAEDAATVKR